MSRLVFITGASSGIGQALAMRFYSAGYRLALAARRTAEVQAWAEANAISAGRYQVYSADVSDIDSIVAAGQACIAAQGVPDVVIANAGISIGMDTAVRSDLDVMAQTFATNNIGVAATFHPFMAGMVARGSGTLVGIGSVAGIRGLPGHGAYCASKAAVIAYCESLRGELRPSGVKVVTICPGYIDTPLTRENRYAMPFLMKAEAFAEKAFATIHAGTVTA
jgi:short-subunit dehydrogenase